MKELLKKLEDVVQESGYQCIRVKDYYDFSQKLVCMGGSYKGFVITEEANRMCMLYIDSLEMEVEAYKKSREFWQYKITVLPEDEVYISNTPEEYFKKFTDYKTLGFYLRATKEYNKFYDEKEELENQSFFTKLKNLFKRNKKQSVF